MENFRFIEFRRKKFMILFTSLSDDRASDWMNPSVVNLMNASLLKNSNFKMEYSINTPTSTAIGWEMLFFKFKNSQRKIFDISYNAFIGNRRSSETEFYWIENTLAQFQWLNSKVQFKSIPISMVIFNWTVSMIINNVTGVFKLFTYFFKEWCDENF